MTLKAAPAPPPLPKAMSFTGDADEDSSAGIQQPPPGAAPARVRPGQARRLSVFVEPVVLEAGWTPPVRVPPPSLPVPAGSFAAGREGRGDDAMRARPGLLFGGRCTRRRRRRKSGCGATSRARRSLANSTRGAVRGGVWRVWVHLGKGGERKEERRTE